MLGAAGGCLVGRHLAKKQAEQEQQQRQQQQNAAPYQGGYQPTPGYGQAPSATPYRGGSVSPSEGDSGNLGSVYTGGAYQH